MIQSITSLKGAVVVIGKAHSEVQMANSLLQVRNLLKRHTSKYNMITEALTRKQRHVGLSLLQQSTKTPASGEIFGILKQMKESFETNLASSQKEEAQAETEYGQLKEAKSSEIAAAKGQIDSKTVGLADSDE